MSLPEWADTLQELRRAWLLAGAATAALLLLRIQVEHHAAAVILGVLGENRWSWQLAAGLLWTLAGAIVMLVPVVAFWPVALAALLRERWTRRGGHGRASLQAPDG